MEKTWLKILPICLILMVIPVFSFNKKTATIGMFQSKEKIVENKINQIIEENNDKTLQSKTNVDDKFIYLEFTKEEMIYTHFVNAKTGEDIDFTNFIRPEQKETYEQKVTDLIYLKYPKFIADVLIQPETTRTYQIKENALTIYFHDVVTEPLVNDTLSLTINYNEIKDCLDFTFLLDQEYTNEDGYHYDKNKKTVALTFDDGPSGAKTNRIVELLEQNKAHATFFMVGNKMQSGASTIQNVLAKGNEIGSHSYNHSNMKRRQLAKLIEDEDKTKEIYRGITGQELIYTRPPYGSINSKIKDGLDTIFITWNLDTEDWLHRDKNYIVDYVMQNVSDGDIILMHDSYDSTVEAVAELLPKLYAEGYQVVSVSELANITDRTLDKHTIYRSLKRNQ